MSQAALLNAVVQHLRQELNWSKDECEITINGRPTPKAGNLFVGVWDGDWSVNDAECLDEVFGVNVTVTMRVAFIPADLQGPEALAKLHTGHLAMCESVRSVLHFDPLTSTVAYKVLAIANALIGTQDNGFVEPLKLRNGGRTEMKGGSWFWAREGRQQLAGLARTMTFGGARRVQVTEEQD